ncbi:MAG TPA: class I adenylate-forming enzyme family protein [Pseudonocardiaceae bacterium]|nr:class I adenylate-forming enzyme family protein [Pseudonocardiaceae bacterium]
MTAKSIRAQLAADPDLGAGNVLTTLVERGFGLDKPTFTFDTDVDGLIPAWQALTVAELDERVRARAATLHRLGIGRADPVAVLVTTAADTVLNFYALVRLGAIPALVNPRVPTELVALYLSRLQAEALIADADRRVALEGHDFGIAKVIDAETLGASDPADAPAPYRHYSQDPVAITHSSGTTGVPKAVVHSHESLFAAVKHKLRMPMAQGTERMLNALPAPHVATLIVINQALTHQTELLGLSVQTGPSIVDTIERWQPSCVFGFATTWADLAKQDLTKRDIGSVAMWFNTGDCAHEAHIRRLVVLGHRVVATKEGRVRQSGSVFIDGLGSSEMGHSHFFITHTRDTDRYGRCVGRPYSFCDLKVFDPDGNELPNYEVGELGTQSPTLALGYWNNSAQMFRTRLQGYFLTGDLVYRDDAGYYYHMDRLVDSVDLGDGKRLYTAMSEERILAACPDVVDCTVSAVHEDDKIVTDVMLQLTADADPAADRTDRIMAALDDYVAATVRKIEVVPDDAIPLGPTGKVRKFRLRQLQTQEAT